ncbi:MAG: peptide-methionine (S)-S-oxide reductase MsrA [Bryobacterales bacterium]|nr:peptide-methionine (S)-S-oxide reductase MsrA [Bryobacterales bacterium]
MTQYEVSTLAGGCFWCLEAVFDELEGVVSVESGYMGGHVPNPGYKEVCTGATGHAEVVRVAFNPEVTAFRELLEVFFSIHDPTTLNRQGDDTGPQYRSAIFYHSARQKRTAEDLIRKLSEERVWRDPIVTEVTPASQFYLAEDYHQEYYRNNGSQPYCMFVVTPKVKKFRERFGIKRKS